MSGLSEQERDSLTECECGHFANEHSGDGCLATDYTEDWRPIRDGDKCSCTYSPTAINLHAIEAIVAAREAAARAEGDDLRSRLACVLEASYWDRGYDERIAAIRGMCDLSTDGMTPAELDERPLAAARAEGAAGVLAEVEELANSVSKGTLAFIAAYEKQGTGMSRRMSGESAALLVEARSYLGDELRAILARHAEGGEG